MQPFGRLTHLISRAYYLRLALYDHGRLSNGAS
jgi:hypothetical protein